MNNAIITAALTGGFGTKEEIPNLPITPEEIAESARESYEAGAAVVHVHLRDDQGRATADLDIARRTVEAIRERCPEVIINLSTGVSTAVPFEERMRLVELKTPIMSFDICSMTFGDDELRNPPKLVRQQAARMLELGIKPELELFDLGHLHFALATTERGPPGRAPIGLVRLREVGRHACGRGCSRQLLYASSLQAPPGRSSLSVGITPP